MGLTLNQSDLTLLHPLLIHEANPLDPGLQDSHLSTHLFITLIEALHPHLPVQEQPPKLELRLPTIEQLHLWPNGSCHRLCFYSFTPCIARE